MGDVHRFQVLGQLEVRRGGAVIPVRAAKQRTFLASLLAEPNRVVSVGTLMDQIWDERPPIQARGALHSYVMRLRRVIGADDAPAPIVTHTDGYQITVHDDDLDLLRFQSLLREAAEPRTAVDPARRSALLGAALAQWSGDPLGNVESAALHRQTVPIWTEQRLTALEQRIDADLRLGRASELLAELRGLTARYPLREHFHAQLMLACYRAGRQADALAEYRAVRELLAEDLGMDPGPALQRLNAQILATDPALADPHYDVLQPAAVSLKPTPLKPALLNPTPLQTSTPLRSPSPAASPVSEKQPPDVRAFRPIPAELPPDIADFTGRRDLVQYLALQLAPPLDDPAHAANSASVPVCIVRGTGGVGKTTLAIHTAHRLRRYFPDGQLHIDLRGARESAVLPTDALARFLRSLGVEDQAVPREEDERAALYRSLLAARRVLIVLDDARDPAQVRPLLPGTAGSAVLVTSRHGMTTLDGASRLDLGVLGRDEARALLVRVIGQARATAEPQPVEAVLDHCAGLPLAIRIAAARLASRPDWTVAALAERLAGEGSRLDELQAEDRAVRASFAVSYAALPAPTTPPAPTAPTAPEAADPARAFRLASLSEGPDIDLLAASALLGQDPEPVAEALGALVQAHLLESTTRARYRYHDLLRLYARELTTVADGAPGASDAIRRMLSWYVRAASAAMDTLHPYEAHRRPRYDEPANPKPPVSDAATARAWLENEHSNLLAVAVNAASHGHPEVASELSITLWRHLMSTGRHNDAVTLHAAALKACEETGDGYGQARALAAMSMHQWRLGRNQEALTAMEHSVKLMRELGYRTDEGIALSSMGLIYWHLGRYQETADHHRQALVIARETGSAPSEANALGNLGSVYGRIGRFDESLYALHEALRLQREAGNRTNEAVVLTSIGSVYGRTGRGEEGLPYLRRALEINRETSNRTGESESLRAIAAVYRDLGRYPEAFEHYDALLAVVEQLGSPDAEAVARNGYGQTLCAVGRHAEAKQEHERALARSRETGDHYQQALAIDGLARVAQARNNPTRARSLWLDALARYQALGVPEADTVRSNLADLGHPN